MPADPSVLLKASRFPFDEISVSKDRAELNVLRVSRGDGGILGLNGSWRPVDKVK